MQDLTIGFIGGGNMARSLVGGLLNTGWPSNQICVSEPDEEKRDFFEHQMGVRAVLQNEATIEGADVVVLAVKPQVLRNMLLSAQQSLQQRRPLMVSIVAGIRECDIQRWSGGGLSIVRTMPNTPALVGSGATGLYANELVDDVQRDVAESLMRAVGTTVWLGKEVMLDVVTALSGSGPAYFMYFMEALEKAAIQHGLAADTARLLTLETCLGAAKLAINSEENLLELRRRVTSPGGTTERALQVMDEAKLPDILNQAFDAAVKKASELGEILGRD
jgi:pyrroline-5-carboxylate reductase